jgi:hypothetical protein
VQASPTQQQGDKQFNAITGFRGAESKFLPALRIVLYDPGSSQISREILDFAGVEADAQMGLQVASAFAGDTGPAIDMTQAMADAGVAPLSSYVPGTAGSLALAGQPAGTHFSPGLQGLVERALAGLNWLVRSPMAGLQMATFLGLLGVPFLLMRRRWTWRGLV